MFASTANKSFGSFGRPGLEVGRADLKCNYNSILNAQTL
jgi:hypothetical protein